MVDLMDADSDFKHGVPRICELYADTHGSGGHWYTGLSKIKYGIVAGVAAAGIVLLSAASACTPNAAPTPSTAPIPAQTINANTIYRDNARTAMLQSVPELANYKSALDYTTQRVVDMKNVYGLSLDEVRIPIAKWAQANIDWDKKGERLVSFNEEIDYIPDTLFAGNATFDLETNKKTDTAKSRWTASAFEQNTSVMIASHDHIWKDLQSPGFVDKYLTKLEGQVAGLYEGTAATFPAYLKAIRSVGTDADKKHWALYMKGREDALYLESGEEIRKEAALTRILSVGGKAKIEIWQFIPFGGIKKPDGTVVTAGHGDLAVYVSPQLKRVIENDPSTFGTPLDTEYLGVMPSYEAVVLQGNSGTQPRIAAMYREKPINGRTPARDYIYGNAETARKYGHD